MTQSRATLIILLAVILVALHIAGLSFEFYWRLSWYDRVVHILGGATAALLILSLGSFRSLSRRPTAAFFTAVLISLVVGIVWELFELKSGITGFADRGYALDTILDIASDVVGGILVGAYLIFSPSSRS